MKHKFFKRKCGCFSVRKSMTTLESLNKPNQILAFDGLDVAGLYFESHGLSMTSNILARLLDGLS